MNIDLIMIIFGVAAAAILFVPTLLLLLLPCVRRAKGGKKAGLWIFGILTYIGVGALITSWAGDVIQNRAGDLSIIAFYSFMALYIVAPCFYLAFFKTRKSSVVYPIIIASLMFADGVALSLVPILFGVTTQFGTFAAIFGSVCVCLPQILCAVFYAVLAKRANTFRNSDEGKDY